ncbi:MAG: hypothetical protein NTZ09_13325 [Candidatus Hydrogenedentes bacterium]|nr:hypothetical protein [Candidatus Hydrogenedentota bacterium]
MSRPSSGGFEEKTRMCPTCRMEISFFATKCRFCGEPVGRPKEEVRQLTVHDLGGEAGTQYAPGEDVVDALEMFRQEEMARTQQEDPKKSWFGKEKKGAPGPGPVSPYSELPGLDPMSRDLASVGGFGRSTRTVRRETLLTKKLAVLGGFVAAILIVYFGGGFVKAKYDDYMARKNAKPVVSVDNQAMAILQSGGSPVDALGAAMTALNSANTPENIEVANRVRDALLEQVETLLNGEPWDPGNLDKASNMAARALQLDPDTPALRKLAESVKGEVFAYKMSIKEIDMQAGTATLRVLYPDRPEDLVVKKKGDKVLNRFEVKSITRDSVRFSDSQRKGKSGLSREFKIFMDGSIKPA